MKLFSANSTEAGPSVSESLLKVAVKDLDIVEGSMDRVGGDLAFATITFGRRLYAISVQPFLNFRPRGNTASIDGSGDIEKYFHIARKGESQSIQASGLDGFQDYMFNLIKQRYSKSPQTYKGFKLDLTSSGGVLWMNETHNLAVTPFWEGDPGLASVGVLERRTGKYQNKPTGIKFKVTGNSEKDWQNYLKAAKAIIDNFTDGKLATAAEHCDQEKASLQAAFNKEAADLKFLKVKQFNHRSASQAAKELGLLISDLESIQNNLIRQGEFAFEDLIALSEHLDNVLDAG